VTLAYLAARFSLDAIAIVISISIAIALAILPVLFGYCHHVALLLLLYQGLVDCVEPPPKVCVKLHLLAIVKHGDVLVVEARKRDAVVLAEVVWVGWERLLVLGVLGHCEQCLLRMPSRSGCLSRQTLLAPRAKSRLMGDEKMEDGATLDVGLVLFGVQVARKYGGASRHRRFSMTVLTVMTVLLGLGYQVM